MPPTASSCLPRVASIAIPRHSASRAATGTTGRLLLMAAMAPTAWASARTIRMRTPATFMTLRVCALFWQSRIYAHPLAGQPPAAFFGPRPVPRRAGDFSALPVHECDIFARKLRFYTVFLRLFRGFFVILLIEMVHAYGNTAESAHWHPGF